MADKKSYLAGSVRLTDLNGFEDVTKSNGVRGCFIPYDQNPSICLGTDRMTGAMTAELDILIRERTNGKGESTHFVKLDARKQTRERLGLSFEAIGSLKIIGNLFTRVPMQNTQHLAQSPLQQRTSYQGQAPAPVQQRGYQSGPQAFQNPGQAQGAFRQPNDGLPAGW